MKSLITLWATKRWDQKKQNSLHILFEKSGTCRMPSEHKGQILSCHAISGRAGSWMASYPFWFCYFGVRHVLESSISWALKRQSLMERPSLQSTVLNPQWERDSGSWDSRGCVIDSGLVEQYYISFLHHPKKTFTEDPSRHSALFS